MKGSLTALLLLPLLLAGFGQVEAATKVERDLDELKRRLEVIEKATVGGGTGREQRMETLIRQQAEQQAELDALRVEVQKLRGALDDLKHTRGELHDLLNMMRSEMELKFNALEQKLGRMEKVPARPAEPAASPLNPAAEYEAALALIQKDGEFAGGRKGLQAFLKKHPGHELAVNASYWVGEAYYGEKKFENAILQFQDVLQNHPQHSKAAAAQLKQAMAFEALGDRETATVLLKKVVKNYPATPEAKKAQEKLDKKK